MSIAIVPRKKTVRPVAPKRRARGAASLAQLRARAQLLADTSIEFIANDSFGQPSALDEILGQPLPAEFDGEKHSAASSSARNLPAHLARLCETRLLTAEQEFALFRRMNFLKYRADQLRGQIDIQRPNSRLLDEAEKCLEDAQAVRDRIVRANMRLVVAIVKKFVSPQLSFDEMLSDGTMTLLSAVEKFDYDRGFRFSTYAYRSIARNAYRSVVDRHHENQRFTSTADEPVAEIAATGDTASLDERTWETLRGLLASMLQRLDGREQFIVSARYALGKQRNIATFQSIADQLGVSKERVRQLEQRAVNKLRSMAVQLKMEELLSPIVG